MSSMPSDSSYDPDAFYVRGSDHRGHRQKSPRVYLPPDIYDCLGEIARQFPEYKDNPGNVIRDACYHILHRRREQLKDPETKTQIQERFQRALFHEFWRNSQRVEDEARETATVMDNRLRSVERYSEQYTQHLRTAQKFRDAYSYDSLEYDILDNVVRRYDK